MIIYHQSANNLAAFYRNTSYLPPTRTVVVVLKVVVTGQGGRAGHPLLSFIVHHPFTTQIEMMREEQNNKQAGWDFNQL